MQFVKLNNTTLFYRKAKIVQENNSTWISCVICLIVSLHNTLQLVTFFFQWKTIRLPSVTTSFHSSTETQTCVGEEEERNNKPVDTRLSKAITQTGAWRLCFGSAGESKSPRPPRDTQTPNIPPTPVPKTLSQHPLILKEPVREETEEHQS